MSTPIDATLFAPDATALKALAHPQRVRMLGLLRIKGPHTASGLARRMGLNSGATSYHLRQLEKHGFIEEDTARGTGRDRWWRARHGSTSYTVEGKSDEQRESGQAFVQAVLTEQVRLMQRAVEQIPTLSPDWQRASDLSDFTMALTPQEAIELRDRLHQLLMEKKRTSAPLGSDLPDGMQPVSFILHAFPHPDTGRD